MCANGWLFNKILSNSQIWREISNKKLNYHLFCFHSSPMIPLQGEWWNAVMLFQKWLNIKGLPRATLLTTKTPMMLSDWGREKAKSLANLAEREHCCTLPCLLKSSNMFESYAAKTIYAIYMVIIIIFQRVSVWSDISCYSRRGFSKITARWVAMISQCLWVSSSDSQHFLLSAGEATWWCSCIFGSITSHQKRLKLNWNVAQNAKTFKLAAT